MEFQKNSEKFSFGLGTQRLAGKGNLSSATPVRKRDNSAEIARIAAAAGAAVLMISWKTVKYLRGRKS